MNDDDYPEITWSDLSMEAPTDRATLRCRLELIPPPGQAGWPGPGAFEPPARPGPGSARTRALTTLCLGGTVGLIAVVGWAIGLPPVAALIAGFIGAIAIYLVVYVTSDRPRQ